MNERGRKTIIVGMQKAEAGKYDAWHQFFRLKFLNISRTPRGCPAFPRSKTKNTRMNTRKTGSQLRIRPELIGWCWPRLTHGLPSSSRIYSELI